MKTKYVLSHFRGACRAGRHPATQLYYIDCLQMMWHKQEGSSQKQEVLASLLHRSRKWRHVVHLYIQPMFRMNEWLFKMNLVRQQQLSGSEICSIKLDLLEKVWSKKFDHDQTILRHTLLFSISFLNRTILVLNCYYFLNYTNFSKTK